MYDNPLYNPMLNPYLGVAQPYRQAPRQEVVKVNGENGARAFPLGANSSALLLDESGTLVWLVTSDGAGYKTVAPFDISPHESAPAPDFGSLEARITKLEEMVKNGNSGKVYPLPDVFCVLLCTHDPALDLLSDGDAALCCCLLQFRSCLR